MYKNTETEDLLDKAIRAVKKYETVLNQCTYIGKVDEYVYELFDCHFYSDNTIRYQDLCFNMMKALAKPAIATIIQNELGGLMYMDVLDMLYKLKEFSSLMDMGNFRAHFLAYELKKDPDRWNDEQLKELIVEYRVKRQGIIPYSKIKEMAKENDRFQ